MSSESQLSTTQTTQQTISSCEDSRVTKLVTEESTSVFESVIKMSENVTANILEETITKSTKMEVEESVVSQKEVSSSSDKSEEKMAAVVVSSESSVVTESSVTTKTDSRTYSDVLKSDIYSESKLAATSTTTVDSKRSIGAEAASEVLKTETVLQLVGSSSAEERSKKTELLRRSEV